MREEKEKLSANEINRYTYCPYQWYYGKIYGQKVLKEKYQALEHKTSGHEGNFKKGLRFHKAYYRAYRVRRCLSIIFIIVVIAVIVGSIVKCYI